MPTNEADAEAAAVPDSGEILATSTPQVLFTLDRRVATITLNRPDARNALSPEMGVGLREAIARADADPRVGAILLTGAGVAFCAGGDVKGMAGRSAPPGASPADAPTATAPVRTTAHQRLQELRTRHHGIAGALHASRKPSIAALPGAAAGAGLAIALACDLRIAARSAFVTTGYARIGLSGDYGMAWLLSRVVGPGRARELLLLSERIDMPRALAIGLVNRVVDDGELATSAFMLAAALAAGPAIALGYIKDNLDEADHIDHAQAIDREAERIVRASETADHREAARAFVDKRPPVFRGE